MKNNFFKFTFLGLLTLMSAGIIYSCKPGETGPEGNANITVINFGTKTFTGTTDYLLPTSVTQGMIDSSLVLAYYNPSGEAATAWYAIPGLGSSGLYETRALIFRNGDRQTYRLMLARPDGNGNYAGSVTFTKFKIIIAPGSKFLTGLNLNDYYEVSKAVGLKE